MTSIPPTVRIQGFDGRVPTRRLTESMTRHAPYLFRDRTPHTTSYLLVLPRCTEHHGGIHGCKCGRPATESAWYDVFHAHETVEDGEVTDATFGDPAATLPPPPRRTFADLMAERPVTLEGWSEDHIRMMGGREEALEVVAARARQDARDDTTVDAYDWASAATSYAATLAAIAPRKLTPEQRVHLARARALRAEHEVVNAHASLRALERNARTAAL